MRSATLACLVSLVAAPLAHALEPPPQFWFHLYGTTRVSQMAETASGDIVVPSMDDNVIHLFTEAGDYVTTFGGLGVALGQFYKPTGVAIDASGNLYVCDQSNHRVQKLSPTFTPLLAMGSEGAGPGQLEYPTNCALSPDGSRLYVTELGNDRVSMFDTNGAFLATFGGPGSPAGQLLDPFGIVVEPHTGDVFVANQSHHRIERFSATGSWMYSIGQQGSGNDDFEYVVGLGIDAEGHLWATDQLNNRVKKLTQNGTVLTVWGEFGPDELQFYNPWSVFITRAGNIWIGDTYNFRVEVYRYAATPAARASWGEIKTRYR
jgi:DNA-binding beta-propeller fold protein YncE